MIQQALKAQDQALVLGYVVGGRPQHLSKPEQGVRIGRISIDNSGTGSGARISARSAVTEKIEFHESTILRQRRTSSLLRDADKVLEPSVLSGKRFFRYCVQETFALCRHIFSKSSVEIN
jgi:hypothetical protein